MANSRSNKPKLEKSSGPDPKLGRSKLSTLEDEWMISRVQGDVGFSDRLIDESYQGITSDGLLHSKADFMQSIAEGAPFHVSAERRESNIQIHGDLAISTGLVTMHGKERTSSFRYLRVYRTVEGKWRLIASQSTRFREG